MLMNSVRYACIVWGTFWLVHLSTPFQEVGSHWCRTTVKRVESYISQQQTVKESARPPALPPAPVTLWLWALPLQNPCERSHSARTKPAAEFLTCRSPLAGPCPSWWTLSAVTGGAQNIFRNIWRRSKKPQRGLPVLWPASWTLPWTLRVMPVVWLIPTFRQGFINSCPS